MKTKKSKKTKKNLFYKILSVFLAIVSIVLVGIVFYIDLLPTKYSTIFISIILIFNIINIFVLNLKKLKKKVKRCFSVITVIAILLMLVVIFYLSKTLGILMNNGDSKYKLENYSVLVLNDSKYKKLEDIENKTLGYYENSTGSKDSLNYLGKKVKVISKTYNDLNDLVSDFLDSKLEVILIENTIMDIIKEEHPNFDNSTRVLYTFSMKIKVESTLKDVNVTKDCFAIYVSGIDTYGKITSTSRSDVNIVMIVNPTTKQVLLVSIPRDYYVQLHGTTGTKDKLTHAGIYGIDMSIKTIEDLLDLKINYYLKVNFTSVIDIVEALGGLDVYSEYSFVSYSGYRFKKGYNRVNGEQALDFARTRKAFSNGDRQRGKNQQALIEAIIRKATSKSIITKYNSLLDAVNGKYQTNMSIKKITSIIKKQLNDMTPWNITSYSLTGKDSNNYTYTYNQLLYVMEPDKESIEEAKNLINKVLNGETLESSYDQMNGSSNTVTKVPAQSTPTPKPQEEQPKVEENTNETDKEEPSNTDSTPSEEEPNDTEDNSDENGDLLDPSQQEKPDEEEPDSEKEENDNNGEEKEPEKGPETEPDNPNNPSDVIIPTPDPAT